jgi:arsenate reductase
MPQRVLFLCTHNASRSQMAEGLLRHTGGDRFEAQSAGTQPTQLHPLAAAAMQEIGIDISGQRSKEIEAVVQPVDVVITLCEDAKEACPIFPGAVRYLHWSLPDPSAAPGDAEARLAAFRQVRDTLTALIKEFSQGAET